MNNYWLAYPAKDFDDYLQDRMLQLAVERGFEIIGEDARNVSPDFRLKHPEIPWKGIIAQRNVLAHEYGAIKQDLYPFLKRSGPIETVGGNLRDEVNQKLRMIFLI